MVSGIQLIGILFGLFMIYMVYVRVKRKEFTIKEGLFWLFSWAIFLFVSIWPTSLNLISWNVLKIGRTMDLIIIFGFIFLAAIVFYIYTLVRINQREIDSLIRNLAIDKAKIKKQKKEGAE